MTSFLTELKVLNLLNIIMGFLFQSTEAATTILLPVYNLCNSI